MRRAIGLDFQAFVLSLCLLACARVAREDGPELRPDASASDASEPIDASRPVGVDAAPVPAADADAAAPPASDAGAYAIEAHDPGRIDAERTSILPPPEGEGLLDQCSRATLPQVTDFWTPTEEQVTALEAVVPDYLRELCGARALFPLEEYYAHYVGVVSEGRRLVYAAFVHQHVYFSPILRGPVIVCDGGVTAWGIAFDPERGTLEAFEVNGAL